MTVEAANSSRGVLRDFDNAKSMQVSRLADASTHNDLEIVAQQADIVPEGLLRPAERLWQILRYYRTSQLLARLWRNVSGGALSRRRISDPWRGEIGFRESVRAEIARMARLRLPRTTQDVGALREDLQQGAFTLLGDRQSLGNPIDWQASKTPRPSRLWRFHLHYQEYLLDLASGADWRDPAVWATIWRTIESWMANNPVTHANRNGDAWHPYCISRRLGVWLQLAAVELPPDDLRSRVFASFAQQAEFLRHNLETDLGGNHLLENVHALVLAGSALATGCEDAEQTASDAWLAEAESMLRRELPRQLLSHGEHFERSAMYHCQVLGNLLQMAVATRSVRPQLSEYCRNMAAPMWQFLAAVLHPDAEIPLFADSCFGETYSIVEIRELLKLAGIGTALDLRAGATVNGPYWVWRWENDAFIFDAGHVAADNLPAHGHCDLLGFEASIARKRWFVDSGLFNYENDSMRRYCRSSVAHNVVTVDDCDQCDTWSAFRMGYRGRPTSFITGRKGTFSWAAARHNGYRRLGVTAAERLVFASDSGLWACFDFLGAKSTRRMTGRLHLAPAVHVTSLGGQQFELQLDAVRRVISFFGVERVDLASGWHCPKFGRRERTHVFEYQAPVDLLPTLGWVLQKRGDEIVVKIHNTGFGSVLKLADTAKGAAFTWQFDGNSQASVTMLAGAIAASTD